MQVDTMFFLLSGQTTQSLLEPALLHAVPGAPVGQVNLFLGRSESSLCQAGTVLTADKDLHEQFHLETSGFCKFASRIL